MKSRRLITTSAAAQAECLQALPLCREDQQIEMGGLAAIFAPLHYGRRYPPCPMPAVSHHERTLMPASPVDAAQKISRKKPGCWAGLSFTGWRSDLILGKHRSFCHLISHVVLCG